MIKGITFDLDGVYFINGKSNFIKNLGELGVSEDKAKHVFLKSDEMNQLYKAGKWDDNRFWSWAIGEWHLDMTPEDIMQLLIDGYEVNQAVSEVVKKVRAAGYKTLICSNNFPARINGLQKRFNFLDNFDAVVLSYEVGETKPSQKIFQSLIDRAQLPPDEIFIADDSEANLTAAKALGIQTHFYTDFNEFMGALGDLGIIIG